MQHSLLKKYENEVNSNAVKQDLINHMKIELDQLTEKCERQSADNTQLMKRVDKLDELEVSFKSMLLDYEACRIKCKKYKAELKCFDEKFFDELEDLKYNFYESIKLNKHYENLLFKLNKNDLIIDPEKKLKTKNRVKFASDKNEHDIDEFQRKSKAMTRDFKKQRLSDLKQSFESMNRSFKSENGASFNYDSFDFDCDVDNKLNDSDLEATLDGAKSSNFEDYDNENESLEYQDLIRKLTC